MSTGKNIAKTSLVIIAIAFLAAFSLKLAGHISMPISGNTDASTSTERYMDIESYVRTMISNLSPVQASLGGNLYVTKIESHGGTGTVYYEDGHNAYIADFIYSVDNDGKLSVNGFTVRK